MSLSLEPLHPLFAAQASGVDLRRLDDAEVAEIERAMDRYAVLVFRGQPLTEAEQVALARRFGPLDAGLREATGAPTRFQYDELIDIGNIALDGEVAASSDQKLIGVLANQLWHSDSTFQDLPVKYSMLSAVAVPERAATPNGATCAPHTTRSPTISGASPRAAARATSPSTRASCSATTGTTRRNSRASRRSSVRSCMCTPARGAR